MATIIAAVRERRVVEALYEGRRRVFCPHMIGSKGGDVKVFAWQFAGQSSGRLPQWRCFDFDGLSEAVIVDGWWRKGEVTAHGRQACIDRWAHRVDDEDTAADFSDVRPMSAD